MPTNNKLIFTFIGQIATGKDTACDYIIEKYGGKKYSFSDMLGDALNRFYLEKNRDNYIKMSECIRETFGEDTLAKTITEDAKKDDHQIICIPNARRPADIKYLSQLPGFVLIEIITNTKISYDRLTKRGEKTDDNNKTYEEFLEDLQRSTELSINEIAEQATEHINNNGTIEELHRQLDKLVAKYKKN